MQFCFGPKINRQAGGSELGSGCGNRDSPGKRRWRWRWRWLKSNSCSGVIAEEEQLGVTNKQLPTNSVCHARLAAMTAFGSQEQLMSGDSSRIPRIPMNSRSCCWGFSSCSQTRSQPLCIGFGSRRREICERCQEHAATESKNEQES